MKHITHINSRLAFAFLLFSGLACLSFWKTQDGIVFLLDTSLSWITETLLVLAITLLLIMGKQLKQSQSLALALLFGSLPFSFSFAEQTGIHFVMLTTQLNVVFLLWTASAISFLFWYRKYQLSH